MPPRVVHPARSALHLCADAAAPRRSAMFAVKRLEIADDKGAPAAAAVTNGSQAKAKHKRKAASSSDSSSSSSSASSDSDAAPAPRKSTAAAAGAKPVATPARKPVAKAAASSSSSSSSSSSDSSSDSDAPAARKPAPAAAPAPFVPVSNVMSAQFGFMLPSGLPPTAAELAAEAARFKPLASVPASVKLPQAKAASSVQLLTTKQLKKLAPVAKLNAAQAAKLDAQELEAYRVARAEEKRQKKLERTHQAPAEKAKSKAAAKKQAEAEAKQQQEAAAAAAAEPKAPKPSKVVAPPPPPSQSAATNEALRGEGLRKKDESVRALERAERKRARALAAGLPVPDQSVEAELAQAKQAELATHVQKLDDMRSARMAAVAERDAGDAVKNAMRGGAAVVAATPAVAAEPAVPASAVAQAIATPAAGSAVAVAEAASMHAKPLWMQRGKQVSPLSSVDVADFHFHPAITAQLRAQGIERFFATQSEVIPVILKSYGINDVAVCAPTGSGKTLAYVLPIVQSLSTRIVTRLRCVVLLPSRDLALQVFEVFEPFCAALGLKVELVFGQHSFAAEQSKLVGQDALSGKSQSLVDILICTPGRLMDHLQAASVSGASALSPSDASTSSYDFHLHDVQYLVIDEIDRLLTQNYSDWPAKILGNIFAAPAVADEANGNAMEMDDGVAEQGESSVAKVRVLTGSLSIDGASDALHLQERCWRRKFGGGSSSRAVGSSNLLDSSSHMPLQKLLFSATLTNNPQKLASLSLHNPLFFTESTSLTKKFAIPPSLKQWVINLPDESQKPLMLVQLLKQIQAQHAAAAAKPATMDDTDAKVSDSATAAATNAGQILIFTSSVESTHRLYRLLEVFEGGKAFRVSEFSSSLGQGARAKILGRFKRGAIQVLICSDAMARGMDLPNVGTVVNYDVPPYIQTYVHRVGRTARAGAKGEAYTLCKASQFKSMRSMLHQADNSFYSKYPVSTEQQLKPLMKPYGQALAALQNVLAMEKRGEQQQNLPIHVSRKPNGSMQHTHQRAQCTTIHMQACRHQRVLHRNCGSLTFSLSLRRCVCMLPLAVRPPRLPLRRSRPRFRSAGGRGGRRRPRGHETSGDHGGSDHGDSGGGSCIAEGREIDCSSAGEIATHCRTQDRCSSCGRSRCPCPARHSDRDLDVGRWSRSHLHEQARTQGQKDQAVAAGPLPINFVPPPAKHSNSSRFNSRLR